MIKSISFKNFKILREATLPLGRFTLLLGPNASGKSTAMQALAFANNPASYDFNRIVTAGEEATGSVKVEISFESPSGTGTCTSGFRRDGLVRVYGPEFRMAQGPAIDSAQNDFIRELETFRIFSFDSQATSSSVTLDPRAELAPNGHNLVGVLDNLRDKDPERFEALNEELGRWLPEFDRVLFNTPNQGLRGLLLRTRLGKHAIQANDLSQGTLFALAFLTLAYLPNHPSVVCFEEPDRGIHPRLLREIRDGMYRLCYPEDYNEQRSPVQVIATTHSPYLLDLYKDHPEEIVIAEKDSEGSHFERLSDKSELCDLIREAPLGEVWYSGALGGVPNRP